MGRFLKHQITKKFAKFIDKSMLERLNRHPSSVYGIDSKFAISYVNPAWFNFAEKNSNNRFQHSDWPLGRNVFDSIPDSLEPYYRDLFESTLRMKSSPLIARQTEYECSSPNLYRRFSMHLYSIGEEGILVVNSLSVEKPYIAPPLEGLPKFSEEDYIDEHGMLIQCANCRRIQNLSSLERWDWVPKFIEYPHPNTSHGICPPCSQHYYSI